MNVYTTHPPTHVYTEKKFKKKTILILEVHDVPDIRALFQRVNIAERDFFFFFLMILSPPCP